MALLSAGGDARRCLAMLLVCLVGAHRGSASAHVVPIPPAVCSVDPLGLSVPAMGLTADPGGEVARLRVLFDANASVIRFCPVVADPGTCGGPTPWPFTLDGVAGAVVLPARFSAVMTSGGDVVSSAVPVSVTLGSTTVDVSVPFTTGLALADDAVLEGAALQSVGSWSWVLVGVVPGAALPAPFTGHALALTVPCPPRPIPDKDQFVPPSVVQRLAGRIAPAETRLRATVVVGPADRPALAQAPLLLALHVNEATVATGAIPGGLVGRRHPTGTSADGGTTVMAHRRGPGRLALTIRMRDVNLTPRTPGARALVGLAVQTSGMLARGERLFHADAAGTALDR